MWLGTFIRWAVKRDIPVRLDLMSIVSLVVKGLEIFRQSILFLILTKSLLVLLWSLFLHPIGFQYYSMKALAKSSHIMFFPVLVIFEN